MARSLIRFIILAQGIYYILTGLWPLISMRTFEAVTGPKADDWLVQMVGLLAITIGLSLLTGVRRSVPSSETVILSGAAALSFALIDAIHAFQGRISRIYLADAAVEMGMLILILVLRPRVRSGY